jgi:uncharacterized membrane protein YdjX (TVP38/TMEM64 family)
MPKQARQKLVKLAVGLVIGAAIAAIALGPTGDIVRSALHAIDTWGVWGGVAFVAIYVVATILFVPGSLLTVGAGFVFGPLWGTVAVSTGSTLGALCAFGIGRHVAGDWVREQVDSRPRLAATIRAVEQDALKIILLLRLVPLFPFNLLNYALGLTNVSWRKFLIASWLGMLPGTFAYIMVGAAADSLARALSGEEAPNELQLAVWGVGALALVGVVFLVARRARAELDAATDL